MCCGRTSQMNYTIQNNRTEQFSIQTTWAAVEFENT